MSSILLQFFKPFLSDRQIILQIPLSAFSGNIDKLLRQQQDLPTAKANGCCVWGLTPSHILTSQPIAVQY